MQDNGKDPAWILPAAFAAALLDLAKGRSRKICGSVCAKERMAGMRSGILFDLDGTLWDSSREVAASWDAAVRKRGLKMRVTVEMIQGVMGKSMDEIADIVFGEYGRAKRRELLEFCCEEENAYIRSHGGRLFEGLEETLSRLKEEKLHLSVVSNCQVGYIEAFLEYHKLGAYFDDFESYGRTGRDKGENIRLVVERNRLEKAVYVGDTQGDRDAAARAGIPFIHAKMGYGTVSGDVPQICSLSELPEVCRVFL